MSYSYIVFAPTGIRNDEVVKFTRFRPFSNEIEERTLLEGIKTGKYEVRLNHGRIEIEGEEAVMSPIDELFIFETLEDADWFVNEGHRGQLYVGESAPDYLSGIHAHDTTPQPVVRF